MRDIGGMVKCKDKWEIDIQVEIRQNVNETRIVFYWIQLQEYVMAAELRLLKIRSNFKFLSLS